MASTDIKQRQLYCDDELHRQQRTTFTHIAAHSQYMSTALIRLECNESVAAVNSMINGMTKVSTLILKAGENSHIRAVDHDDATNRSRFPGLVPDSLAKATTLLTLWLYTVDFQT